MLIICLITMASNLTTIADLRKGKKTKLTILQVYIHKLLDEETYLVGDQSDIINMSVAQDPKLGKGIAVDRYYRIVDPKFDGTSIILQRAPLNSPPFAYKKCGEDVMVSQPGQSKKPGVLADFQSISSMPVHSTVPKVVSKVTYLSPKKMLPTQSYTRTCGIKDVKGAKHAVQLFGSHTDNVELGKVYAFRNLVVKDFQAPSDTWPRLGTRSNSMIEEADSDTSALFSEIHAGDGTIRGTVLGHENPNCYLACPYCGKKCTKDDDKKCPALACRRVLDQDLVCDFHVNMQVDTGDEVKNVFCFRRQLGITIKEDTYDGATAAANQELEKLSFKKIEIVYQKDQGSDTLRAVEISFPKSTLFKNT